MAMAVDPFDFESTRLRGDSWVAASTPGPRPLPPVVLCLPTLFGAATFTVAAGGQTASPAEEVDRR